MDSKMVVITFMVMVCMPLRRPARVGGRDRQGSGESAATEDEDPTHRQRRDGGSAVARVEGLGPDQAGADQDVEEPQQDHDPILDDHDAVQQDQLVP